MVLDGLVSYLIYINMDKIEFNKPEVYVELQSVSSLAEFSKGG